MGFFFGLARPVLSHNVWEDSWMNRVERCKLCGANLETEAFGGSDKGFDRMRCRRCGEDEITHHAFQDIEEKAPFVQPPARQDVEAGRRRRISHDNWPSMIAE